MRLSEQTEDLPILLNAGDLLRIAGLSMDAVLRGAFGLRPVARLSDGAPLFTATEALRVRAERLVDQGEETESEVQE